VFAYLAFVVAVVWIYITANEIVNLLEVWTTHSKWNYQITLNIFASCQEVNWITIHSSIHWSLHPSIHPSLFWALLIFFQTFGVAFKLSDAILGLTFLAWGNSIGGDYWTDTSNSLQQSSNSGFALCRHFITTTWLHSLQILFHIQILNPLEISRNNWH